MASAKKALGIIYPEHQKYSCSDCPARCCTSPWGIPVTTEERERILSDDEARARLDPRTLAILRAGVLPMREHERRLCCVFLDDDLLCSLHKKHGHAFIPAPCQAYPFGFSQSENGRPVALLSRYCPSIRDSRGEPVEAVLAEKLEQAGGARPLSDKMGLRSGRVLPKMQFASVVERWRQVLVQTPTVAEALMTIYSLTDQFDDAMPKTHRPSDAEVLQVLASLGTPAGPPLRSLGMSFSTRILLAYLLGGLCYPSRVLLAHRATRIRLGERLRGWANRLAWLFSLGTVDLYLVTRPVPLRRLARVRPVLSGRQSGLVSDYLAEVVLRRQGMSRQTYLTRVVVDLALMAVVISRHARAAAASVGSQEATADQVKEAIGIAELLFAHQGEAAQATVLQSLRLKLMSEEKEFRRLLAGEV